MTCQETHNADELIINLTIEGTYYEKVEVKVTDPNKTIRDQISSIVAVFELPKLDNGGNPIHYLLGQIMEDGEEPEILEFEDEDGREQTLADYNIQPGDHLQLITAPMCGGIWCNIFIVKSYGISPFKFQVLKIFKIESNSADVNNICRLYGGIDAIISRLVSLFNLPSTQQYYLAKINRDSESKLRFYFLNGETGTLNYKQSIFDYTDDLEPNANEWPDVILFPTSGISNRIIKKINKYYNRIPRYLTI